ncbi:MAG: hypothetical protein WKF40_09970 [Thermoleophilaceae bacterium]
MLHDGAHNPAGAQALAEALPERDRSAAASRAGGQRAGRQGRGGHARGPAGALRPDRVHPLLEPALRCRRPRSSRCPAGVEGPPVRTVADPRDAVGLARTLAGAAGAVVVTGSIYLIADLVRIRGGAARASRL